MNQDVISVAMKTTGARVRAARVTLLIASPFLAIIFSYFVLDRPLSTVMHPYHNAPFFVWLTYIASPLVPAASILVAVIGVRSTVRGRLTKLENDILRVCCAILIAGVLTHQMKDAFGRTWPETWVNNNPSYFSHGTYGFFPFHGGQGYRAFPSGHTTVIAAATAAIWFLWPTLRWLGLGLTLAVAIGLMGANYHWLSDVMAGALIGGCAGVVAAKLRSARPPST